MNPGRVLKTIASCVIAFIVVACNPTQTLPEAFVMVNGSIDIEKIVVTSSPMNITVKTFKVHPPKIEIFDGTKSLGLVSSGTKRADGLDGLEFQFSKPVAAVDNGEHSYTAMLFDDGGVKTFASEPTVATLQLK